VGEEANKKLLERSQPERSASYPLSDIQGYVMSAPLADRRSSVPLSVHHRSLMSAGVVPWFRWPTPPSDLNNIDRSSVPSLPQLFLHFLHRRACPVFPHCRAFLALFPHIVALFPRIVALFLRFSRFLRFLIARSRRAFRALPSVSWCLVPGS